jgi:hypothetical protein
MELKLKFVHGPTLLAAIQSAIAEGNADMAVAFWGRNACGRLKIPGNAKGSRVACDARSGSCNPSALSDLLERGVAVVDVPRLHAKVYIGNKEVIIASANASTNGLGEEDDEVSTGLEVGYHTARAEDLAAARQWFEAIFKQGVSVTKDDLPELRTLWRKRQEQRPLRDKRRSFLNVLTTEFESLENRNLRVAFAWWVEPPKAIDSEYKLTPFYDHSYDP